MKRDERRQHPRVDVAATAVVLTEGSRPVHYEVDDLSVGGALLRGGPRPRTRDAIRLALYIGGNEPLVIDADLVRQKTRAGSGSAFAVTFRDLTPVEEDVIQDAILRALEGFNGPSSGVRGVDVDQGSADLLAGDNPTR
jgi:PilZ domain